MRTGVIARKEGMTRIFSEEGRRIPVTVLKIDNCQVTGIREEGKHGYTAVQLGAGAAKVKQTSKAMRGVFAASKVEPKKKVAEFRVDPANVPEVGAEIVASHFVPGQYVDVCGTSIGKGFQGGMKRHNFGGLRASHGVSISHRSHGSTGNSQDPGDEDRVGVAVGLPEDPPLQRHQGEHQEEEQDRAGHQQAARVGEEVPEGELLGPELRVHLEEVAAPEPDVQRGHDPGPVQEGPAHVPGHQAQVEEEGAQGRAEERKHPGLARGDGAQGQPPRDLVEAAAVADQEEPPDHDPEQPHGDIGQPGEDGDAVGLPLVVAAIGRIEVRTDVFHRRVRE